MPNGKATHQKTKMHNRDLVLQTIFSLQAVSRAEIARLTKLTRATVSEIVAGLIEEGLVEEIGYGASIGGKAPILLSIVADSRYLIGLNLAQDKFIGAVVNLRGEIKEIAEIPIQNSNGQQALQFVYQILDGLIQKGWAPIAGIGVGTPGLVNSRDGIVLNAVNLDWKDLPLAALLTERYHLPVCILNDSQANAIGEFVYGGEHKPDSSLIVINARHGIGAGILINGRLFQGDGGGAGEIGHVVIQEDGALCRCGKRGCLETVASATAVVRRAQSLAPKYSDSPLAKKPENISLDALIAAYHANDPLAIQVVTDAAHYLGNAIASLVGTLNIHKIVLTGDMTRFGESWRQKIEDTMHKCALERMAVATRLEIGKPNLQSCILGASAAMLLDGYNLLFQD